MREDRLSPCCAQQACTVWAYEYSKSQRCIWTHVGNYICRKFQKQPTKFTIFCISYPAHQVPCHSSRWDAWKMPISVLKILININNWFGGADNSIGRVLRRIVAIVGEVIFSGKRSLGSMRDSSVSVSALLNVSWKEQIGINIVSYLMDARPIRIMLLGKYGKERCRAELLITE